MLQFSTLSVVFDKKLDLVLVHRGINIKTENVKYFLKWLRKTKRGILYKTRFRINKFFFIVTIKIKITRYLGSVNKL